jgi:hypothetical protein
MSHSNAYNLLLHRTFQYLGIILIMVAMGGGYWYWKNAQAGINLQSSQEGTLSNGLVGYWPFNGKDISGTTTYDRSGQGNDGTLANGPTKAIGRVGQALDFDGMNDHVITNLTAHYSQTTFSAWIYPRSSGEGNLGRIFDKRENLGTEAFFLSMSGSDRLLLQRNFSLTSGRWEAPAGSISLNTWSHVVVTYDSSLTSNDPNIYINGLLVPAVELSAPTGTVVTNSDKYIIGNRGDTTRTFNGSIDEPRFHSRALSVSEIWDLYQLGNPDKVNSAESQGDSLEKGIIGYWKFDEGSGTSAADASAGANAATLTNGPTWTTGQIGSAVDFDGTDDYTVATLDGTALPLLTVAFWANSDATPGTQRGIFQWASTLTAGATFMLLTKEANGTSQFYVDGNYRATTTLVNGTWNHLAISLDASYLWTFYLNGNRIGTYQDDATQTYRANAARIYFGNGFGGYSDGKIDEARVYNRALSAEEVAKLYKTTAPDDPDQGLVGYWPFNGPDISGTTAYDRSGQGNNGTLTNGPTKTIGKIGQGLSFDGTDRYVDVGNNASLQSSVFTYTAWVNPSWSGGPRTIKGTASWGGPQFRIEGDNRLGLMMQQTVAIGYSTGTVSNGVWSHVGVSYDVSGNYIFYINGVVAGSGTHLQTFIFSNHLFGKSGSGPELFVGSIDEPRIYDRTLSATEIWDLYQMGNPDKVNSADSQGDSLEKGMVGYWKLDDASGTSAVDSSGNGNTGTLTNGPTWTTGRIGGAVDFDGTNDYINAGTDASLSLTGNFSLSAWINPSSYHTTGYFGLKNGFIGRGPAGTFNYALQATDATTISFIKRTSPEALIFYNFTGISTLTDQWTLVSAIVSGSTVTLYINGQYFGAQSIGTIASVAGDVLYLGTNIPGNSECSFTGKLDEVRIYNRALSAEEVAKLYRTTAPDDPDQGLVGYWPFNGKDISGTTAFDRSGKGNNGTLTNSPTKTIGKSGQGLSFNGTNQYSSISHSTSLNISGQIALSAWVNVSVWPTSHASSCGSSAACETIIEKGYNGTSEPFHLRIRNISGVISLNVGSYNSPTDYGASWTISGWNLNEWHHVVGLYNGSNWIIYVDGVQKVSTAAASGAITNAETVQIGASKISGAMARYFNGKIDEPRVYNRALSAAEVTALYNAGR